MPPEKETVRSSQGAPRAGSSSSKFSWWRAAGPGLIAGAADDDPAGIVTFSSIGAQFGTQMIWTTLFSWPLMAAVQMACARIGMVTGQGLAAALREKFPAWLVACAVALLLVANIATIAADLAGMADALLLLTGIPRGVWIGVMGIGISVAAVHLRYRTLARALMVLAVALLAYVVCGFLTRPDWHQVFRHLFTPAIVGGAEGWKAVIAVLGTTISPYLFFWQAGQEVEEEQAQGRTQKAQRVGATAREVRQRRIDVTVGTFISNLVMFFVVIVAAQALHGHHDPATITTAATAQALQPLAGAAAPWVYAVGVVGTGLLALPTLAGSAAYGVAEAFGWRSGMDLPFHRGRAFYQVFIAATTVGAVLTLVDANPIRVMVWSAVINGVLAGPLLLGVFLVAIDRRLMRGQPASLITSSVVLLTVLVMTGCALAYFLL
jgi:NRAMP (natural resistance-associated macrophage protein)-like metal ion transporter